MSQHVAGKRQQIMTGGFSEIQPKHLKAQAP